VVKPPIGFAAQLPAFLMPGDSSGTTPAYRHIIRISLRKRAAAFSVSIVYQKRVWAFPFNPSDAQRGSGPWATVVTNKAGKMRITLCLLFGKAVAMLLATGLPAS